MPQIEIEGIGTMEYPEGMSVTDAIQRARQVKTFYKERERVAQRREELGKQKGRWEKIGKVTSIGEKVVGAVSDYYDFVLTPWASTPENPLGGLGAGQGKPGGLEPAGRTLGRAFNYAGDVAGATARDVRLGDKNLTATMDILGGKKIPTGKQTPGGALGRGIEGAARIVPLVAGAAALKRPITGAGASPSVAGPTSFGLPMYWTTYEATDDVGQAVQAGALGTVIQGVHQAGRQQAANLVRGAIEKGMVKLGRNTSQKIAEEIAGLGAIEGFLGGMDLPHYLSLSPEERNEAIIERVTMAFGFGAMSAGRVARRSTPSLAQQQMTPKQRQSVKIAEVMERVVRDKKAVEVLRNSADEFARRTSGHYFTGELGDIPVKQAPVPRAKGQRPIVPETAAQPYESVGAEVKRMGVTTIRGVQELYPESQLNRERAREILKAAYPKGIPKQPTAPEKQPYAVQGKVEAPKGKATTKEILGGPQKKGVRVDIEDIESGRVEPPAVTTSQAKPISPIQTLLFSGVPMPGGLGKAAVEAHHSLAQARQRVSDYVKIWKPGGTRDEISQMTDAMFNKSRLKAREWAMDVLDVSKKKKGLLKKKWKPMNKQMRSALRLYREAEGNIEQLKSDLRLIQNKQGMDDVKNRLELGKTERLLKVAIKEAEQFRMVNAKYDQIMNIQHQVERDAGYIYNRRKNYVPRHIDKKLSVWDRFDSDFELVMGRPPAGKGSAFRNPRKYDRTVDAVLGGEKLKVWDAIDALEIRITAGERLINRKAMIDSLAYLKDPMSGMPIKGKLVAVGGYKDPRTGRRKGHRLQAELGYDKIHIGGDEVGTPILRPYNKLIKALMGHSSLSDHTWLGPMMKVAGSLKHYFLMFDVFHMNRLAFITGGGFLKKPWQYKDELSLLEHNEPTLRRMARRGEIPADKLGDMLTRKATLNKLVDNGLNVGRIADALYTDFLRSSVFTKWNVGAYNKWLFEKYQRGIMSNVAISEYERIAKLMPELTDKQVAQRVARDINVRYGNLMNQSFIKRKDFQDALRLVFLAPQWNEGLLRSELGGYAQLGKSLIDMPMKKRMVVGSLGKQMAWLTAIGMVGNQLASLVMHDGKLTWETNPEGEHKYDLYIPDPTGLSEGVYLSPFTLSAEHGHQYSDILSRGLTEERAFALMARYKLGPLGQSGMTLATGKDVLGRTVEGVDFWKSITGNALALPIGMEVPIRAGLGLEPKYEAQVIKQGLATLGLKTSIAHNRDRHDLSHQVYGRDYFKLPIGPRLVVNTKLQADQPPLDDILTDPSVMHRVGITLRRQQKAVLDRLDKPLVRQFEDAGIPISGPQTYIELGGVRVQLSDDEQRRLAQLTAFFYNRFMPEELSRITAENKPYETQRAEAREAMNLLKTKARGVVIAEMGK